MCNDAVLKKFNDIDGPIDGWMMGWMHGVLRTPSWTYCVNAMTTNNSKTMLD